MLNVSKGCSPSVMKTNQDLESSTKNADEVIVDETTDIDEPREEELEQA